VKVSEIMTSSVYTITSDKSVAYAAERMNEWRVGSLVIMDNGEVKGIITSRDVRSAHPNRIVADAMTSNLVCVSSNCNIWDAFKLMEQYQIERIIIMDTEKMAGMVTREAIVMKMSEYWDSLSGLYRAPYIQYIGEELLQNRKPFHLLFIDINDFGNINKVYGHPFGDDVIRTFSSHLTSMAVDNRDFVCRYAGDEFVMITLADEEGVANYIQSLSQPMVINNVPVSASVGCVNGQREPDFFSLSLRELLENASLLSSANKPYRDNAAEMSFDR